MADSKTIQITLKAVADIKDVLTNTEQIKKALSGLSLPKNLTNQFERVFGNLEKNVDKASAAMATGFKTKGDVSAYEKATNQIVEDMKKISSLMGSIDTSKLNFDTHAEAIKALNQDVDKLKKEIEDINSKPLEKLTEFIHKPPSKAGAWEEFFAAFKEGDIETANKALGRLQQQVEKAKAAGKDFSEGSQWKYYEDGVLACGRALDDLNAHQGEVVTRQEEQKQKQQQILDLQRQASQSGQQWLADLIRQYGQATQGAASYATEVGHAAEKSAELEQSLNQFKGQITTFFGLQNAVRLFQRALRSAFNTVKELDAVMTQTAVVTSFDVGDMWAQLPVYTQRANELGVAIKDVYEADTLYYQQGLKTNEVIAVSGETMKMARIAGLGAAEATDRMTNALRGFNMEITEANAQNINDVYSHLAAITASNTDEISTAMTKVASLAHNANMSFENTAAFLSQIIETTRESAETAGTALKTVIARFSEVKKLYSEGDLMGTDEEGQEIDVNKVSSALRSAGINLNEYLTGAKGLDAIFIELSQKWDSLDQVQQRYIATMAAGSRQQSRFIALMQDYNRMAYLTTEANNAAGASQAQFEKTLGSLQSKLAQLSNAWNTFVLGIADSSVIKFVVDALTNLLTALNNITDALPGLAGSLTKVIFAFGGFKIGKAVFTKVFASVGRLLRGEAAKAGDEGSHGLIQGFQKGIQKRGGLKNAWKDLFTSKNISDEAVKAVADAADAAKSALNKALIDVQSQINDGYEIDISAIYHTDGIDGGIDGVRKSISGLGIDITDLEEKTKTWEAASKKQSETIQKQTLDFQKLGVTAMALGGIFQMIGSALDDGTENGKKTAQAFNTLGTVFMGVGVTLTTLGTISKATGDHLTIAGLKAFASGNMAQAGWWPFIAIIAGVIAVIGGLIVAFNAIKANSPEAKLERAREAAKKAGEAANETAESYNKLNDAFESLGDKYSTLETLARGTKEWNAAVLEINQSVLDLMEQFDGLNVEIEGGVLRITNMDDVLKDWQQRKVVTQQASIFAQMNEVRAELATSDVYNKFGSQESANTLARQIVSGSITKEKFTGSDELYDELYDLGLQLQKADSELESFTNALNASALEIADVPEKMRDEVSGLMDTDQWNEIYKQAIEAEKAILDAGSAYEDQQYLEQHREEYARAMGSTNYEEWKTEKNKGEEIDLLTLANWVGVQKASEKVTAAMKAYANGADKLSSSLRNVYKANEGAALAQKDIEELTGKTFDQIKKIINNKVGEEAVQELKQDESIKSAVESLWNNLDPLIQPAFGNLDIFTDKILNSVALASEGFGTIEAKVKKAFSENAAEPLANSLRELAEDRNLEIGQVDGLISVLSQVGIQGGDAQLVLESIASGMDDLNPEKLKRYLDQLTATDWTDTGAIESTIGALKDLGIELDDSLVQELISASNAASKFNLDNVKEQLGIYKDAKGIIEKGGFTFSGEDLDKMVAAGVDRSEFKLTGIDEYTYIGKNTNDLLDQIDGHVETIQKQQLSEAREAIRKGEAVESEVNKGELNGFDRETILRNIANGAWSLYEAKTTDTEAYVGQEGRFDLSQARELASSIGIENADILSSENLVAAIKEALDYYDKLEENRVKAGEIEGTIPKGERSTAEYRQLSLTLQDEWAAELHAEAGSLGIDVEELESYTAVLQANNAELEQNHALALYMALANTKMNQGLGEIIESYKDWTPLIDESTGKIKIGTKEDAAAFDKLKASTNKMLNTTTDLSDAFWDNVDNMALLKKAAEGDTEALEDLQVAASRDYVANLDIVTNSEEAAAAVGNFYGWVETLDIPEIKVGMDISDVWEGAEEFKLQFNDMVRSANMSSEQIQEAARRMGFDAEIQMVKETRKIPQYETYEMRRPVPNSGGDYKTTSVTTLKGYTDMTGTFPVVKTFTSLGSGGGGVSTRNIDTGRQNAGSNTGGGSSGSGGSSDKNWENPYDELYNLTEEINEALRTREKLEREYDRILKRRSATAEELRQNSLDQIAQLQREIDLQRQLLEGRRRQLQNLSSETFTDSEGNESTFGQLGMERYARYDEELGRIIIDWDAINQVTDPEQGAAIEAYIKRLEEIQGQIEDAQDQIADMEDLVEEIRERGMNEYLELEERVYNALVEQQQQIIDNYQALADSINEANERVIEDLREQIDLQRQIRDNTEAEEDIAEKEARLAYLQRDTSGANQLEILRLQEEIDDARQAYSDRLIDQAIDQMQKDNNLAAEQRANQIRLMQAQLDWDAENGAFWNDTYKLINDAFNSDGSLNLNSKLVELLKGTDAFDGMSFFGKENWIRNMAEEWKAAMEGRENWAAYKIREAEEAGSVEIGGKTYTYKNGKWYDESGQEYEIGFDPTKGEYTAKKKQESSPAPTPPAPTPPGGGGDEGGATSPENPYGKASEVSGTIRQGARGNGVKAIQWALKQMGYDIGTSGVDGIFGAKTAAAVKKFQKDTGLTVDGIVGTNTKKQFGLKGYAKGGLVRSTGLAWLDGKKSKPEMVLSSTDTENLIALKDILSGILQGGAGGAVSTGGDNYFDIDIQVDELKDDYDVDKMVDRIRQQIYDDASYRNVNVISFMR